MRMIKQPVGKKLGPVTCRELWSEVPQNWESLHNLLRKTLNFKLFSLLCDG